MDMTKYIKMCCVKLDLQLKDIAERTGQYPQTLNKRLHINNFKVNELEKIAAAMDCKLKIEFIDNNTGKPLI